MVMTEKDPDLTASAPRQDLLTQPAETRPGIEDEALIPSPYLHTGSVPPVADRVRAGIGNRPSGAPAAKSDMQSRITGAGRSR